MQPTLHVIGVSTSQPLGSAEGRLSRKVARFVKMMGMQGYPVIDYSNGVATGNVPPVQMLSEDELLPVDRVQRLRRALSKYVRSGDVIVHPCANAYDVLTKVFPQNVHVQLDVHGTQTAACMPRIFDSYTHMRFQHAKEQSQPPGDFVVPNYQDLDDWVVYSAASHTLVYCGQIDNVHMQELRSLIDSSGDQVHVYGACKTFAWSCANLKYQGVLLESEQNRVLGEAKAVVALSSNIEPSCTLLVGAMLSGTPVICVGPGSVNEMIHHGRTGFRVLTCHEFSDAARRSSALNRDYIALCARRVYSLQSCAQVCDDAFMHMANNCQPAKNKRKNSER